MKKLLILLTLFLGFSMISSAQTDPQVKDSTLYLVVKTDGGEFYGYILSDDGREILLMTRSIGKLYISKADIKSISKITDEEITHRDKVKYADFRVTGPFTTRYAFTTNALPIKEKENYALIHLYGPEVHFALNDQFSLGIMSSWIASPIGLAAKYAFPTESDISFSLGTIALSSGYLLEAKGYAGLHWATVTNGSRKSNISFSAGYGYADLGSWEGFGSIGEKYNFEDLGRGIYNNAEPALIERLFDDPEDYDNEIYRGFCPSVVIGISGITPVGKKSSFIFDAMGFFGHTDDVVYNSSTVVEDVTYEYEDPSDHNWYTITEDLIVPVGTKQRLGNRMTFVVMPAMRFNRTHTNAFQVALSGIITIDNTGDVTSFPAPMVSWLRQF